MRMTVSKLRALMVIAVGIGLVGQVRAEEAAEVKLDELSIEQVATRLKHKNFFLYDNNSKESWTEGHVPGAKWVDYKTIKAEDLPADKGATLVFYCANEH